jgi:hypothetical protein
MKFTSLAGASALAILLTGCADSISQPTALTALPKDQLSAIHISHVTGDAASDVMITSQEIATIDEKVQAYIKAGSPGVMVDTSSGDALTMKLHFTRFDRGSAVARFILIGLGQIHIDATVTLVKSDGTSAGEYQVKKTFALGGIAGAATRIEDVEEGFAKSVAEIVKEKTSS